MIAPTTRLVILAFVSIPLAIITLFVSAKAWVIPIAYIVSLLVLVVIDARSGLLSRHMSCAVTAPSHIYIGDTGRCVIHCETQGRGVDRPLEILLDANDRVPVPATLFQTLDDAGRGDVELAIKPIRRGILQLETLWVRWPGIFGLVWHRRIESLDITIKVIPDLGAVKRRALTVAGFTAYEGEKLSNKLGSGNEFDSLRDFQTGMDHRTIDWKHSAKHHRLVSKEFRTERNHNIVLVLDTGRLMREPLDGIPKIDRAINAGLVLAHQALTAGDRVGFLAFDASVRAFYSPQGGLNQFPALQTALSEIEYQSEETNFTLGMTYLLARIKRRSLIVVLTDFADTATTEVMVSTLGRVSIRHLVLFLSLHDRSGFDGPDTAVNDFDDVIRSVLVSDMEHERLVILDRLRQLGIHVLDTTRRRIDSDLINRYTTVKQQALI